MKKKIRVALAGLLSILLVLSVYSPLTGALQPEIVRPTLQFKADGTLKILQITDTQDTDQMHIGTRQFIEAALDEVQPDLVVFTGDNTVGYWLSMTKATSKDAIDAVVGPVNERGIPFAVVPGNHDGESIKWLVTLKDQLDIFMSYPMCLAVDDGDLTGCSTYNMLVKDHTGTKDIFNIYMVDSGGYKLIGSDQDLVAPDQVEWYKDKSDELKALNGGVPMPSMLFQHIPVPEFYYELMTEVEAGTADAIEGKGDATGKYYLPDEDKYMSGTFGERPKVASENVGFYDAWVEQGDIFAAFFGHDHNNSYVGKTDDDIVLGFCRGTGFHSYGSGTKRGVRSFTIYEDDIVNFDTELFLYSDLVSTEMPEMPVYSSLPWHENYDFAPVIVQIFEFIINLPSTLLGFITK